MRHWVLLFATASAGAATAADYLTSIQPASLSPVLHPGDTTSLPVDAAYNNTTFGSISVVGYIQDDPACPTPASSHPWITFGPQIDSMSAQSTGTIHYQIPFDATGMNFGSYRTNLCIAQSGNATDVVPILLKVVASDDIFFDGFD